MAQLRRRGGATAGTRGGVGRQGRAAAVHGRQRPERRRHGARRRNGGLPAWLTTSTPSTSTACAAKRSGWRTQRGRPRRRGARWPSGTATKPPPSAGSSASPRRWPAPPATPGAWPTGAPWSAASTRRADDPRRPHRACVRRGAAGVRWRRGGRARWRVGGGVSLRVLVTGGRDFDDRWRVFDVLDAIHRGPFGPIRVLVSGHARGADTLAEDWATTRGVTVERHPADWDRHGRRAGILRNVAMLDTRPDRVVVFPGGRGTAHCAGEARARGL